LQAARGFADAVAQYAAHRLSNSPLLRRPID
jgi:hypothetical protein